MEGISSVKIYNAPVKNSVNQERQRAKNYSTPVKTSVNQEQQHVTNPNLQALRDANKKLIKVDAVVLGICGLLYGALGVLYMLDPNPKAKKLAKHIDFSPAKTLEDAMKFGKKKLGIKKYEGFEATDLGVVNWINEGLTNVSNVSHGKLVMPKKVEFTQDLDYEVIADVNGIGVMRFSKPVAKRTCDRVKRHLELEELREVEAFLNNEKPEISKTNKLSFSDMTYTQIRKYYVDKIASNKTHRSPFSTVYHEMGHLQHRANHNCSSFLDFLKKSGKSNTFSDIDEKYAKLFDKSKDVARSVSEYATTDPSEFVAECYSAMVDEKLCNKTILSDEARELYKKLGGAQI